MKGSGLSTDTGRTHLGGIDDDIRRHLVALLRKGAYDEVFTRKRPTRWHPTEVRNPNGCDDEHFTRETAWTFILQCLERGEPVEVIRLYQPPGRKGYVMKINIGSDVPELYIKLELGSGTVWGRSFHYDRFTQRGN